jgi:AcrR family transcriptional regulator
MTQLDAPEARTQPRPAAAQPDTEPAQPKLGRRRDHGRDQEILDATLDVLAENGYTGLTIDMVAARAKAGKATLYRRWPSKGELVIDAVSCMKQISPEDIPDTGTLRGDLVAMVRPHSIEDSERKFKIMSGLMSMLSDAPELTDTAHEAIMAPRARVNRQLMQRAIDRGEIPATTDVDLISGVSQAMASYRSLMLRKPVDREFLLSIIDGIILPAVGLGGQTTKSADAGAEKSAD